MCLRGLFFHSKAAPDGSPEKINPPPDGSPEKINLPPKSPPPTQGYQG